MTGVPSLLAELLTDCEAHGIRLVLAGDGGLTIDAPQDALTPELLDRLIAHKADVRAMLRGPADTAASAGTRHVSPDERRRLIGDAVDRMNAAYSGGPIDWPVLDAIERHIDAARTLDELQAALAEYVANAGRNVQ